MTFYLIDKKKGWLLHHPFELIHLKLCILKLTTEEQIALSQVHEHTQQHI
jgi:hypothetical protein